MIFTAFITLLAVIGVSFIVLQFMIYHRPPPARWLWAVLGPAGLFVIWLQWKTLQTMIAGLEGAPHPRPVSIALRQRHWPAILRPLVAAWWLGQFAIVVFAATAMSRSHDLVNPTGIERAIVLTLQVAILSMGAYASTCSMLFGLAALWRNESVLTALWKGRVFIDLAIALAVSAFVQYVDG
ncbi:MAG: hypothetical protein WBD40_00680 [Tepidisphaeraceae bacterium]